MRQKATVFILFASLLAAGSSITGCATTGVERAAKATNTMQTVESEYRQIASQADATNASLRALINPDQQNTKQAFESYKKNVAQMEKLNKQLEKHSADMTAQGQNYFAEWEKVGATYTNPQMRQLSEERRLELRDQFAQIPAASVEVKSTLLAYVNDIKDIEKLLSNDLSPNGIRNVGPVAQRAMQKGEAVKTSVNPVLAAIQQVRTAMTPGGTTGSAAGGEQPAQQPEQQPMQQPEPLMEQPEPLMQQPEPPPMQQPEQPKMNQ